MNPDTPPQREAPAAGAARALALVDAALGFVASVCILAIMAIVGTDVFLRYFFSHPIPWAYDAISLYLVGAIFFFSLSDTFASGGHVSIDLLVERFGPAVRRWLEAAWCLASAVAFALVCWLWMRKTWDAWQAHEVVAGVINWPVWLSTIVVPVGTAALLARLLLRAMRSMRSPAGGG